MQDIKINGNNRHACLQDMEGEFFFLKYGEWLYTRPPLGTIHPTPYCIVEREDLSLYAHIILGGVY